MKQTRGRLQKGLATFLVLMCIIAMSSITVFAASAVREVRVNVKKQDNSKYPTITVSDSNRYEITNKTDWDKAEADIIPGETISCTITVMPKEGYYFYSDTSVRVNGAQRGYTYKENGGYVITISYTVNGKLERPLNVYWDSEKPWNAVVADQISYADDYEYVVYANGEEVKRLTTDSSHQNFAKTLGRVYGAKNVYFKVRAISYENNVKSSEFTKSEKFTEWSKLRRYCEREGLTISYDYYYDDDDYDDYYDDDCYYPNYGYNKSDTPSSYYKRSGDNILTSASTTNGYWTGGAGNWWFWHANGALANGWIVRNGYWYYIDNGRLVTGWRNIGERRYYFNPIRDGLEGAMYSGWKHIGSDWYYFYTEGERDHVHGEMAKSRYIDNSYVDDNGRWTREK